MNTWVLIIAMYSPGGDYIDKRHVVYPDQQSCQSAKIAIEASTNPMGVKNKGLCVTHDHWTGKKPMPNVALD